MKRLASCLLLSLACASSPPPAPSSAGAAPPAAAPAAPAPAAPVPAPPPPPAAPAAAVPVRTVEAILADAVKATGGEAAWNAHKSVHMKHEMTFQGMGITGAGERFATKTDKALVVTDLPGIGTIREGSNGKVAWAQDPVNGLRILEAAEAEQARIEAVWNPEPRIHELYQKVESTREAGPGGAMLECLVLTPKLSSPVTNCYDPATHLQVLQKGTRATPQGDTPFISTLKDWRDVGGVKMAFGVDTQAGPITFTGRITDVKFDEALDDRMFEPPSASGGAGAPAGGKGPARKNAKPKK